MRPRLRLDDVDDERTCVAGADPRLNAIPARRQGERLPAVELNDRRVPLFDRRQLLAEHRQPSVFRVDEIDLERFTGRERPRRDRCEADPERLSAEEGRATPLGEQSDADGLGPADGDPLIG